MVLLRGKMQDFRLILKMPRPPTLNRVIRNALFQLRILHSAGRALLLRVWFARQRSGGNSNCPRSRCASGGR